MKVRSKLLLFLALVGLASASADGVRGDTVVRTSKGSLRGTAMTSRNGRVFHAFRGVRYALPPIGELRFKAPVAVSEEWSDIKNATEDGASCPQPFGMITGPISEDCLFLNVYTPEIPIEGKNLSLPVIFWIHRGGWMFLSGQSDLAGPQYIMDENVVLVTINYRLGALGFLSTGDSVAPGNNGLKDQVAALEWVRDNIASFGGDPNLVTLYGYRAGAEAVQLHMVSPLSAGLFHRAISSSGSALSPWVINRDPKPLARRQAGLLDCPHDGNTSSESMIQCLRSKDADDIAKSVYMIKEWAFQPNMVYVPVIEAEGSSDRPFLTSDPESLFQSANFSQVPWVTGSTDVESMYWVDDVLANQTSMDHLNENFDRIMPMILFFDKDAESARKSQQIREFYLGNKSITQDSRQALTDMITEFSILHPIDRSVKIISGVSSAPVYYYQFTSRGSQGHGPEDTGKSPGATLRNDLYYIFHREREGVPLSGSDNNETLISQRLVKMLNNFARTGNPTPDAQPTSDSLLPTIWTPYTPSNHAYMHVSPELEMKSSLRQDRVNFWNEILSLSIR